MLRNDYVLKIVERIGNFINKIARAKKQEHVALEEELGELFFELFGLSIDVAFVMDSQQLAKLAKHPAEIQAMADIFRVAATLWSDTRPERTQLAQKSALELYLENLYIDGTNAQPDVLEAILDLKEHIEISTLADRYRATLEQL